MNCAECEELFDAYLEGQLGGSLRLEFDAHRVRCRRCQQTLAMLEAIGNVIAADPQVPELPADFTARVMSEIERPRRPSFARPRVRFIALVGLQAAAVIVFAWLWQAHSARSPAPPPSTPVAPVVATAQDEMRARAMELLVERFEDRLWEMHAAGAKITSDLASVARYLNIMIPEDVVRESVKMAGLNPLQALWDSLLPTPPDEVEPAPADQEVHSI